MKRILLLLTLVLSFAMLAACGSGTSARTSTASGTGNNFGGAASGGVRALTPEAKLALGTVKLEGTPQAVDPVLAAKLLPFWQLLQQLSTSATAAPQEVTAVVDQIQATMTPTQVSAINNMQFTQADLLSAFQQARPAGAAGAGTSGAAGASRGGGGGGGFPGGGFPGGGVPGGGVPGGGFGGGGGGFGGGGTRPSTGTGTATASGAGGSTQAATNRTSGFLVSEVIRLLESKISS